MNNKKDKKQMQSDPETITRNNITKNTQTEESPDSQPKTNSKEVGGRQQGLEPTRYGDWEFKGRCIDF